MSWTPNISNIEGPRYLALAGAIASAIDGGDLLPGAQLPPQRDLARDLGVTVGTVGRAYALAKSRRLVTGEVGRGTFVRGAANDDTGGNVMPKPPERNTVDLVCYRSPVTGLREMLVKALDYSGEASKLHVNSYAPNSGFLSHRIAGAAWIARAGFVVPPEQVILVNGAQQGISVALAGLCARGETVLRRVAHLPGCA
ncbi:MAG: GntR family transcriptional regulator, partial [Betaproteobacteria bacterium]|nr:GntR family transcriptional regulator [Betaproteobacteria bacterium]